MSIRIHLAILILSLLLPIKSGFSQTTNIPMPGKSSEAGRGVDRSEKRILALQKLLEGQRHYRSLMRARSQSTRSALGARAREAFRAATEFDPTLAEAFTALAELSLSLPPGDIDEALAYADSALLADANNFGANRIRARLFTIKSGLNNGDRNAEFEAEAIRCWLKITAQDPRNAEAWAFLSELYRGAGRTNDRIEALRKWLSSATPVETRFFQTVVGNQADLSPEAAAVPLGEALLEAGRPTEAAEILNNAVADEPENAEAIELLKQALDFADTKTAVGAVQTLEQVVFSSPDNVAAITLLARLRMRAGQVDVAVKLLSDSAIRLRDSQPESAAALRVAEGELLLEAGRYDASLKAYESALQLKGVLKNTLVSDFEREFFLDVLLKRLTVLKVADRFDEVQAMLLGARTYLREGDPIFERESIALLRETGKRPEALQAVRNAKVRYPNDQYFLRQEAVILNELGKTDEAVKGIRTLVGRPSESFDDFSNWLFIASLHSSARRFKDASLALGEAVKLAKSAEERQIADVTLANLQRKSGDLKGAEATLRGVLKTVPGNPFALNNLGYLLAEKGEKLDEAAAMIFRAVKTDPTNPSFLDSLGWVFFKQGRYETAHDFLMRALRLDPTSATINAHVGDVFEKLGDASSSKTYWRRAQRFTTDRAQLDELNAKLSRRDR